MRSFDELPRAVMDTLIRVRSENNLPAVAGAFLTGPPEARHTFAGSLGQRVSSGEENVGINDKFHIGSCTKAMTATMLATLVEEGRLQWEMTLGDIPKLSDQINPVYRSVTLEQLLHHRSGLPDDRSDMPFIMKLRELEGSLPEQRLKVVNIGFNHTGAKPPGEFMYSNTGYIVAAAMAEEVTALSWEDLMHQRLFTPLGMRTAGFGAPDTNHPSGHRKDIAIEPGLFADNPACMRPAGSVHISIIDWLKFVAVHLDGENSRTVATVGNELFLDPNTLKRLHTPIAGDYAAGWLIGKDSSGGTILSHEGSNTLWMSCVRIAVRQNLAMLFAANAATSDILKTGNEIFRAMESNRGVNGRMNEDIVAKGNNWGEL